MKKCRIEGCYVSKKAKPTDWRPSFRQIFMRLAHELSGRSTCQRLQVGCVIVSSDWRHIYGLGYNGGASGDDNKRCTGEEGNCGCLHAEDNAVTNCNAHRSMPKVVLCTNMPCGQCARRFVNLGGVHVVYYRLPYRNDEAVRVLANAGIKCVQLKEED